MHIIVLLIDLCLGFGMFMLYFFIRLIICYETQIK